LCFIRFNTVVSGFNELFAGFLKSILDVKNTGHRLYTHGSIFVQPNIKRTVLQPGSELSSFQLQLGFGRGNSKPLHISSMVETKEWNPTTVGSGHKKGTGQKLTSAFVYPRALKWQAKSVPGKAQP
jgi:hypothetical protein